eukprot:3948657-Prymnesium_polylepis.1
MYNIHGYPWICALQSVLTPQITVPPPLLSTPFPVLTVEHEPCPWGGAAPKPPDHVDVRPGWDGV